MKLNHMRQVALALAIAAWTIVSTQLHGGDQGVLQPSHLEPVPPLIEAIWQEVLDKVKQLLAGRPVSRDRFVVPALRFRLPSQEEGA